MKYGLPIASFVAGLVVGFGIQFLPEEKISVTQPPITLGCLGKLTGGDHSFAEVIRQTCQVEVLPFDRKNPAHLAIETAILDAAKQVASEMSQPESPAREKSRINEVSSLFENALREKLTALPDLSCDYPKTASGEDQRSGYPDLRIEYLPTGTVVYLDPKLFQADSIRSSFRTFYYEPGGENSKVTENAVHLLIGFPHDGKTREWTFGPAKLIDLSTLEVTLKTEFSASNKEVYNLEAP